MAELFMAFDALRSIGVPALAIGIASGQFACARFGPLTPWKGGGFGMFATIDTPATRALNVRVADVTGHVYRVEFSDQLRGALSQRERSRARAFPSQARLRAIAAAVLAADLAPKAAADTASNRLISNRYAAVLKDVPLSEPTVDVIERRDVGRTKILNVRRVDVNVFRPVYDAASATIRVRHVAGVSIGDEPVAKRLGS